MSTTTHRAIVAEQTSWTTCNWYIGGATMRTTRGLDLLRKSGEFPMSYEELDDTAATVYEGI
jgi:hypothetical protein